MSTEIKEVIDGIGRAFEEFKSTNDQRLAKIEKGQGVSDLEAKLGKVETEIQKLGELKSEIEALEKRMNRPGAPGEAD